MVVRLEITIIIDKKFLFTNVPNGMISLQHEMQNQGSFDLLTGESYIRI